MILRTTAVAAIRRASGEALFATFILFAALSSVFIAYVDAAHGAQLSMLNVSYDPTREFYKAYNDTFAQHWKQKSGDDLFVQQSHAGSGAQARAVIDGLPADVVTLALAWDIDAIADQGHIDPAWQSRLPNNSSPYTSTIVFLVRDGNPLQISDWGDLIGTDVEVITPNPKTSGGARWNYLAAWAWALEQELGDMAALSDPAAAARVQAAQTAAREFVAELFQHVPVLDTGARGSTNTFVNGIGDVLLACENEALLAMAEFGDDQFDVVVPPLSILAEPPVTWVDRNVNQNGTAEVAQAYLEFLFSDTAQVIAAKHYYRPRNEGAAAAFPGRFPEVRLVTIDEIFGGWRQAQADHFADGGVFDQIYGTAP